MNISASLTRAVSRGGLQLQKYSPQILTVTGVAGLIVAGVLAAKSTLKLESTMDEAQSRLKDVNDAKENGSATQKDVNRVVVKNTVDLGKLYWKPVTLAAGSAVLILVGHNILHKRNLAVVAAYKGLEEAFAAYRHRVIEELGPEKDEQFRYGIREVTTTDENGKKVKALEVDHHAKGDYIYSFGPENWNYQGNPEHNLFFITQHEQIFNQKLQAYGHVFLNDVLRALGYKDTEAGAVTGWINNKDGGDGYISFGIKDLQASNGYVLLEFNVDGIILDRI